MAHRVKKVAKLRGNLPFSSEIRHVVDVKKTRMVKSGGLNCSRNGRAFYCLSMARKLIVLFSFIVLLCTALASAADSVDPNLVAWWMFDNEGVMTALVR